MKIAFTSTGTEWTSKIDPRLGRTSYIGIYDEEKDQIEFTDNRAIDSHAHGAGTKTAQLFYELNPDVIITGNGPGNNAAMILSKLQLKIFSGAGELTLEQAYKAYKQNLLKEFQL